MRYPLVILSLMASQFLAGQELPVYNEYHLNKSLINPAIIGSEACTWVKCTDRHQWIGMAGAPQIQTISLEASIFNKKALRETDKRIHGIGGYLYRDKNGAYRTLGGQVSYAYHVYLSRLHGIKLGMGLSFRFIQASLNESGLKSESGIVNDPLITGGVTSVISPNAGAGAFMYSSKFYFGLSAANLLGATTMYPASAGGRNYFMLAGFLTGGARNKIRLLPSCVIKATAQLQKQMDLNLKVLMGETWWLALSYRHNLDKVPGMPVSFIPMVGVNKGSFGFAYALDLTPSRIQRFNYGTHEFMLSYHFCRDGYRCPVYR